MSDKTNGDTNQPKESSQQTNASKELVSTRGRSVTSRITPRAVLSVLLSVILVVTLFNVFAFATVDDLESDAPAQGTSTGDNTQSNGGATNEGNLPAVENGGAAPGTGTSGNPDPADPTDPNAPNLGTLGEGATQNEQEAQGAPGLTTLDNSNVSISSDISTPTNLITGTPQKVTYFFSRYTSEDTTIYIPLPKLSSFTENPNKVDGSYLSETGVSGTWHSGLAAAETSIVRDFSFTYNGQPVTGDFIKLFVAASGSAGTSSDSFLTVDYQFANGTTAAGYDIDVTGYILGGSSIAKADDKKLVATTNEDWSISKSISAFSSTEFSGENPTFVGRPYIQVGTGTDKYDITYKLSLTTSAYTDGQPNQFGRVNQSSFTITDTISVADAAPATTIKEIKLPNGTLLDASSYSYNADTGVLTFDVPTSGPTAPTNNLDVYVTVSVDKDTYTTYANNDLPNALYTLANQANLTTAPVVGAAQSAYSNSVPTSFGWYQLDTKPRLTINKLIKAINLGGEDGVAYTSALQAAYGDVVKFTLTKNGNSNGDEITIGDDGQGISEELAPGVYTLAESATGISSEFTKGANASFTVTPPDSTGTSYIDWGGTEARASGPSITITNVSTTTGQITVKVVKQKPKELTTFEPFANATVYLDDANGHAFTAETNSAGYATFTNVPTSGSYTLNGVPTAADANGILYKMIPATGVTISGDVIADDPAQYQLQYITETGSFKFGKVFQDLTGTTDTPPYWQAKFELWYADGPNAGAKVTDSEFTINQSSGPTASGTPDYSVISQTNVLQREIPEGNYYLVETSVKTAQMNPAPPDGWAAVPEAAEYQKITLADRVAVNITAGNYTAVPIGGSLIVDDFKALNKSNYGEIAIQAFNYDGSPSAVKEYKVVRQTPLTVDDGFNVFYITTGTDGKALRSVPAGTYDITLFSDNGKGLQANEAEVDKATTTSLIVATANPANPSYTASGGKLATDPSNAPRLTAAFVYAKYPNVSGTKKTVADVALAGSQFTLYKLDGSDYKKQDKVATSDSSGNFSFVGLDAGTYVIVESSPTTNYLAPAWVSDFYNGSDLLETISDTDIPNGAPTVTVTTADYQVPIKTLKFTPETVKNTPINLLTINTVDAVNNAPLLPATGVTYTVTDITVDGNHFVVTDGKLYPDHTYLVTQTTAPGGYVINEDVLMIIVNEDGEATCQWGTDSNVVTRKNQTASAAPGSVVATFSNAKPPVLKITKMGEVDETFTFTDHEGKTQTQYRTVALSGAVFTLSYEEENGDVYYYDSNTKAWATIAAGGTAPTLTSGANGSLLGNDGITFDPNKEYKVAEISAPKVPGSDADYKTWDRPSEIKFKYKNGTDRSEFEADGGWVDNGSWILLNEIDPHFISIEKLAVDVDVNDNVTGKTPPLPILTGTFTVYRWNGVGEPDDSDISDTENWIKYTELNLGGYVGDDSAIHDSNKARSQKLPGGYYKIVETKLPGYSTWSVKDDSELYVRDSETPEAWTKTTPGREFIVDLTTDDADLTLGNTKMVPPEGGDGGTAPHWIQVVGSKTSWSINDQGETVFNGFLNGVNFDLKLAYKDGETYVPFGPALQESLISGTLLAGADDTQVPGGFASKWFNINLAINEFIKTDEYNNLTDDAKTAIAALMNIEDNKFTSDLHLVLIENSGLPSSFTASYPQLFGLDLSVTERPVSGSETTKAILAYDVVSGKGVGACNENYTESKTIKNVRGSGKLLINKYAYTTATISPTTVKQNVNFEVYKQLADGSKQRVEINGGLGVQPLLINGALASDAAATTLTPGIYFFKEVAPAVAGYNLAGTYEYSYKATGDTKGKFGPYGTDTATGADNSMNTSGFIGPITVPDSETVRTLTVKDYPLANLKLTNWWNGEQKDTMSAVYEFTVSPSGYTPPNEIKVTGKTALAINNLIDGDYSLSLKSITDSSGNHIPNVMLDTSVSNQTINFTVKNGEVINFTVGTASMATTQANGLKVNAADAEKAVGTGLGIWRTNTAATATYPFNVYTININHPGKGTLVITKNFDNNLGAKAQTFAPATPATFTATEMTGQGQVDTSAPVITITVSNSTTVFNTEFKSGVVYLVTEDLPVQEVDYRVAGTSAATGVYVRIDAPTVVGGFVYLKNAYAGNSFAAPLTNADTINNKNTNRFTNYGNKGRLEIVKWGDNATSFTNLQGAEFEIYSDVAGTSASKVATVTAGTILTGRYLVDLPAAETGTTYYVKEIKAPAGKALRTDLMPVTVKPRVLVDAAPTNNNGLVFGTVGYAEVTGKNKIVILNAPLAELSVAKETVYAPIKDANGNIVFAEEIGRVKGMILTLYKNYGTQANPDWKIFIPDGTTGQVPVGTSVDAGFFTFAGLDIGEYKVVESLPTDGSLEYLNDTSSPYFDPDKTPIITVSYDATSNKLVYSTSADTDSDKLIVVDPSMPTEHPAGADASWYPHNLLTINNLFDGARFAVHKVDYDDESKAIEGAIFELYKQVGALPDVTTDTLVDTQTTDAEGNAIFKPVFVEDGAIFYVAEKSPAPGYVCSPLYDSKTKPVGREDNETGVAVFKNKKIADPVLAVSKNSSVLAAEKPLATEGFTTTYTLTPATVGNTLPIQNYRINDAGVTFTPVNAAPVPTYKFSDVKIYRSTAQTTKDAISAVPVYASVNGGAWQELSSVDGTSFGLNSNDQDITVAYSQTDPGNATPEVGINFTPGKIEFVATFDQFIPNGISQDEITKIRNSATVAIGNGIPSTPGTVDITVPVDERPEVVISKALTGTSSGNTTGFRAKDTISYRITLTNNGGVNSDPVLELPIIVDYLPSGMSLVGYNVVGYTGTAPYYESVDNVLIWEFSDPLAEGGSIEIDVDVRLDDIVIGDQITNEAYGTSGAELLFASKKYATRASFVSGATPELTIFADSTYPQAQVDCAKLDAVADLTGKELFVKATLPVKVNRSGEVEYAKNIKLSGSNVWLGTGNILNVGPSDVIDYRLLLSNGFEDNSSIPVTVSSVSDTLPANGAPSTASNTEWTSDLTGDWIWSGDPIVKLASDVAPLVKDTDYTVIGAGTKAFTITFTPALTLVAGDVLTVEYPTTALPSKETLDGIRDAASSTQDPYADNAQKLANNVGTFAYNLGTNSRNSSTQAVTAKFVAPPASVSGIVWEDSNIDGTQGVAPADVAFEGATVTLNKYVGGVLIPGSPTTLTDSDGKYTFADLESSYGMTGNKAITYEVVVTKLASFKFTVQGSGTYSTSATDSDVDVNTGSSGQFTLDVSATVDAGVYTTSTISGIAWLDKADIGVQTGNDTGLPGVSVALYKNGNLAEAKYTGTDGSYNFSDLEIAFGSTDTYRLVFDKSALSNTEQLIWSQNIVGADATLNSDVIPLDGTMESQDRTLAIAHVAQANPGYGKTSANNDAGLVPTLRFEKRYTGAELLGVGDTATWNITVTNRYTPEFVSALGIPEALTFNNVTITENLADVTYGAPLSSAGRTLASPADYVVNAAAGTITLTSVLPGETITIPASYVAKASDAGSTIHNVAVANGKDVPSDKDPDVGYKVTYNPNNGAPSWTITVKAGTLVPSTGTNVTYPGNTLNGWFLDPANSYLWNFSTDLMPERDITLNAIWTLIPIPPVYFYVYYDANGGTGTQVDANAYTLGSPSAGVAPATYVTILGQGNIVRPGYTFTGWNTAPDGSGTAYAPGYGFNAGGTMTFYAQWSEAATYTVTYDANGGTGTQVDPNSPYVPNALVTILGQGGVSRTGYSFLEWNTEPDGTGTSYLPGTTFNITGDVVLYAIWESVITPPTTPQGGQFTPNEEIQIAAQTGNPLVDLLNGNVPLGGPGISAAWSLLNLIMSVVAIIIALITVITIFGRKREEDDGWQEQQIDENGDVVYVKVAAVDENGDPIEDEESEPEKKRRRNLKILVAVSGIIPAILFILLEDITLPIVWIDRWTLLIGIFFLIHVVLLGIQFFAKKKEDEEDVDEDEAGQDPVTGAAPVQI